MTRQGFSIGMLGSVSFPRDSYHERPHRRLYSPKKAKIPSLG
jgi:hypothetical protein